MYNRHLGIIQKRRPAKEGKNPVIMGIPLRRTIESLMVEFMEKTNKLNESVVEIAGSIDSISNAIDEGVNGVTSTVKSMHSLAAEVNEVFKKMDENREIAGSLKKETEIFVNL